ncbi:MAG: hypothetical protein R2746_07015 [Acidimicrobiales bacterium]
MRRRAFVVVAVCAASVGMAGAAGSEPTPRPGSATGEAEAAAAVTAPTGMLRATTSPALPSQISLDGKIADTWGLEWVHLATGSHTVCFSAVAGYTTPPCQAVTVDADATTTVVGTFTPRGYLKVTTSPAVASQISVDGIPRNNWGVWTDLPVGGHEVCFGAVAGYTAPACQAVTLAAGTTTEVTGTFTPSTGAGQSGLGQLRVTSSPAVPTQISVDGEIADSWGLNWLEIAPGGHRVCFSAVQGYTAPGCQTVTVAAGQTATAIGTFTPRGFLKVDTSPAVPGTISIDGFPADDWGVYTDLPTGPHRVCFGAVKDKVAPPCQSPTVEAGQTTTVTGTYGSHWFCLDDPISTAAEQYQALNHHDTVWQGGDGAKSVVLPDGRTVWLFGDTITGTVNPDGSLPPTGWKLVRGTALVQQGACVDPVVSAQDPSEAATLIPQPSFEEFFWPDSGFVDASGSTLWVIAKHVKINPAVPWGSTWRVRWRRGSRCPTSPTSPWPRCPTRPTRATAAGRSRTWRAATCTSTPTAGSTTTPPASRRATTPGPTAAGGSTGPAPAAPAPAWSTNVADLRSMAFDSGAIGTLNVVKTGTGYAIVGQFLNEITAWKGPVAHRAVDAHRAGQELRRHARRNGADCKTTSATPPPTCRASTRSSSGAGPGRERLHGRSYLGVDDPDLPLG